MKRLLAAGAFALSAVLLPPPTAASAAAAGPPSAAPSQEPHRPLIPTTRTTVRHAARLAPGAAPASVTTTVTDADCSAPAAIAGPLSAGTVVTGTTRLDDVGDPYEPGEGENLLLERQDASGATTVVATITAYYSTQPYSFAASADGDRLVACISGGDGADGDEQATITANVPPAWQPWTSLPGVALNSYPDCHSDAAGIGCWARSAAAQLVENDGPADGPRSWTTIGGSIAGPPTCLVRTARTDCFASTSLNRLAWITYNGATWGSWIDLGANASGQPYCLLVGVSGIDCYAGGTDHAVRRWSYNGASWKAPVKITGASTVSRVTCVTRSGTDCFYLDAKAVAWTFHVSTTGKAQAPKKIGTGFGLAPVCINSGSGKLDCFAQSKTHTLLKGFFNGSTWATWSNLGGNVVSDAACTEPVPGSNPDFDCFWTNSLGHMVERQRTGGVWQGEIDLGGSIQQKPACILNGGRKDCFARGLDNALWQKSYY